MFNLIAMMKKICSLRSCFGGCVWWVCMYSVSPKSLYLKKLYWRKHLVKEQNVHVS